MADWENNRDRIEAAFEAVLSIPGVHSAYIGRRYRNGRETDEMALCVMVGMKKPLEQVAPPERVPREVAGIPTDVLRGDPPQKLAMTLLDPNFDWENPTEDAVKYFDTAGYKRLRGGIMCQRDGVRTESGTIGCIATLREDPSKYVLLSAYHVLVEQGDGKGTIIRQPDVTCCCCGRNVGVVVRGVNTCTALQYEKAESAGEGSAWTDNGEIAGSVDAAIALVSPGIEMAAEIQRGNATTGDTDLVSGVLPRQQIALGITVQKRGCRTGFGTKPRVEVIDGERVLSEQWDEDMGIVWKIASHDYRSSPQEAATQRKMYPPRPFARQLLIDLHDDLPANAKGLFRFAAPGDSGALVMTRDPPHYAVGLLWGTDRSYQGGVIVQRGIASNIHDVREVLKIEIATAVAPNVVLVNHVTAAPSPFAEDALPQLMPRSILEKAHAEIEETQFGRQYVDLVRRHHSEVRRLVRTNRRVGVVWQRYGGQQLLQTIINGVAHPDEPFPLQIGAHSVAEGTARVATILKRYGSASLARDVETYQRSIASICGCTYNQLLVRLRAGESLVS